MSKYIIEIKPEYDDKFKGVMILGVEDSNLFVDTLAVENLEQYTPVDVEKIYDKAYRDGYNKGIKDGKAINDKGCEGCKYQANKELTCPCSECANNYKNQWKAKDDKIVVGDEVADKNGYKTIVTYIYGDLFDGLCSDGSTITNLSLDDNHKTGRHFDIDKILDEMKGNNDK